MKATINADGSATVTNADEGNENEDGSEATATWNVRDAGQLGLMVRGLEDVKRQPRVKSEDHPWSNMSKGDKDAARDAANEARKQAES